MITKVMSVDEFIDSPLKGDEREIADELVKHIRLELGPDTRLTASIQPLYRCDTRVLCGGDCELHICYREGYGYTGIHVFDMGHWYCQFDHNDPSVKLNYKDIVFYDGDYDEIYDKILGHANRV